MNAVLYNDHDPAAAFWLRRLADAGHLPQGRIDARPIQEVEPHDLEGVQHCHLFAGIGGWAFAARLADWPDDLELWTASAPCQPFSAVGKRQRENDPRHVWPDAFRLIRSRRPAVVVGEQVSSRAGLAWFDGVGSNLEGIGYAVRAIIVPACAVNAPHARERLYFVARLMGDTEREGLERFGGDDAPPPRRSASPRSTRTTGDSARLDHWRGADWSLGPDGITRRIRPGLRLLAHGIPGRVERLRGFGNAVVPQLAAEVLRALLDDIEEADT